MSTEQEILRTELRWGAVVAGAVAVIVAVTVVSSAMLVMHPPSNVETIDPSTLHLVGEFVDGNLGTFQNPDGTVTARFLATQFAFEPDCLQVPADTDVLFRVTSPDVIHGLIVATTNTNTMVVPGYISQVRTRFSKPGTYLMPCHEYCGLGHSGMQGRVQVVPQEQWTAEVGERTSCEVEG